MSVKKNKILNKYEIINNIENGYANLGFGAYGTVQLGKMIKT
jgi:hypothetical protein